MKFRNAIGWGVLTFLGAASLLSQNHLPRWYVVQLLKSVSFVIFYLGGVATLVFVLLEMKSMKDSRGLVSLTKTGLFCIAWTAAAFAAFAKVKTDFWLRPALAILMQPITAYAIIVIIKDGQLKLRGKDSH